MRKYVMVVSAILIILLSAYNTGYAQSKKEPCVGCLFSWLIPGAGMFYAQEYKWGAVYLAVNGSLMVWSLAEQLRASSNYEDMNLTPLALLVPLRIIEYVHTWSAVKNYNKNYGFSIRYNPTDATTGLTYDFFKAYNPSIPTMTLAIADDCKTVKFGAEIRF